MGTEEALLSEEKPQLASLGDAQPLQRPNKANVKKWHGQKKKEMARSKNEAKGTMGAGMEDPKRSKAGPQSIFSCFPALQGM